MHDTVMLVLDDKYVVTEEAIEGMKFTLPENYIWCLTHMTTSGKERFTIVMSSYVQVMSSYVHCLLTDISIVKQSENDVILRRT